MKYIAYAILVLAFSLPIEYFLGWQMVVDIQQVVIFILILIMIISMIKGNQTKKDKE